MGEKTIVHLYKQSYMKHVYLVCFLLSLALVQEAQARQPVYPGDSTIPNLPKKYLTRVTGKANAIQRGLDKSERKALQQVERIEKKIKRQLLKVDPLKADVLFGHSSNTISNFRKRLEATGEATGGPASFINNYTDTLETTFKFLEGQGLAGMAGTRLEDAKKAILQVKGKLQVSENIQASIRNRKAELVESIGNISRCKAGLSKLNKRVYYYHQQLNDYKEMLQEPSRAEEKAMAILRKSDVYKSFVQKHSMLASLFNINMNEDVQAALADYQTMQSVEQQVRQGIGSDISAQEFVSQQMQYAASLVDQAKSKISSGSLDDVPNFTPNSLKTKPFLKRMEYAADIQSQPSNVYLPTMLDLALQIGYKFSEKGVAGLGVNYKFGFGENLSKVRFTSEGVGLRSFASYRLKGILHLAGGWEFNHYSRFYSLSDLSEGSNWAQSILAGVKINAFKVGKYQANFVLFYDFKANQSVPRTSVIKFRYQYTL